MGKSIRTKNRLVLPRDREMGGLGLTANSNRDFGGVIEIVYN